MTRPPTRFITSHPWLVVCSAERATALCTESSTQKEIAGLLSISDPPPYKAARPSEEIISKALADGALASLLDFRDIITDTDEYKNRPDITHAAAVIEFAKRFAPFGEYTPEGERVVHGMSANGLFPKRRRIVVHCAAGRSRSSAAAFIVLCAILGPGKEREAMAQLLKACERTPLQNTILVKHADALLNRNGAMIQVAKEQNDDPADCEADGGKPVTGTALLAAIRRGEL